MPAFGHVHEAFVALGANLGDRAAALRGAVDALAATVGVAVAAASPVYETAAHTLRADDEHPDFLNAVVQLHTTLGPVALLDVCLELERRAGRDRSAGTRWAPRPLDLDVLLYDDRTLAHPRLTLPHPRLGLRRFVLRPLADLAPGRHVPAPWDAPVQTLLARCPDTGEVRPTAHRLR